MRNLLAAVTSIGVLAGLLTVASTPPAAAAQDVNIGTIKGQMVGHRGQVNGTDSRNCIRFDPQLSSSSTTQVSNPREAAAAHGRPSGNRNCPSTLDRSRQSAIGITPSSVTTATTSAPFLLGTMRHYNNPVTTGEPTSPGGSKFVGELVVNLLGQDFRFPYELAETPNRCNGGPPPGGSSCSDDIIDFTSQVAGQVTVGTFTFRLVSSGFTQSSSDTCRATPEGSTANRFVTRENRTTTGCLYGELSQERSLQVVKQAETAGAAPATVPGFDFTSNSSLAGSAWNTAPGTLTPPSTNSGSNSAASRRRTLLADETVTIEEAAPPASWSLTQVRCVDGVGAAVPFTQTGRSISLTAGEVPQGADPSKLDVTCTFTNTYRPPTFEVRLEKQWQFPVDGDKADLTITGGSGGQATSTAPDAPAAGNRATSNVPQGAQVTVAEALRATNKGTYSSSLQCTGATPDAQGRFTMPAQNVTCTFTNTRALNALTVNKRWEEAVSGDEAELAVSSWISGTPTATSTAPDAPGAGNQVQVQIRAGDTVRVRETLPASNTGRYSSSLQCTGGVTPDADGGFVMPASPAVTCTFTNTRTQHSVTLRKTWQQSFTGDTAQLTISGGTGGNPVRTSTAPQAPTGANSATADARTGDTVTVSEVLGAGNTGSYRSSLTCDGVTPDSQGSFTMPGRDVTCTFRNERTSNDVTLSKTWVNGADGDTAQLRITGGGTPDASETSQVGAPSEGVSATKEAQSGSQVTVSEVLGANNTGAYSTLAVQCSSGGTPVSAPNGVFTMPDADVACRLTNTRTQNTLTVQKKWVDGFQGDRARLRISGGSGGTPENVSAANGDPGEWTDTARTAVVDVASGATVDVTETLAGFNNTGRYDSSLSCDSGVTPDASGEFEMPDADVTCTLTNTRTRHTVTLRKVWQDAVDGHTAGLQITGGLTDPARATSTSPGGANDPAASTQALSGVTISLSEDLGGDAGKYNASLSCDSGIGTPANASFTMPNQDVTCTFTNTRIVTRLTVQKTWVDGFGGDRADLEIVGGSGGNRTATSTATGAAGSETDTVNVAAREVRAGATVVVAESLPAANTSDYTTSVQCTGGVTPNGSGAFEMPPVPVTCTFTNTRATHDVQLRKRWVDGIAGDQAVLSVGGGTPDPAQATSTASGATGSELDSANTATSTVRSGDRVTVGEGLPGVPASRYRTSLLCVSGGQGVAVDANGGFTMPKGSVTCTLTNSRSVNPLIVRKTWVSPVAGDGSELTITGGTASTVSGTSTAPGDPTAEIARDDVPAGALVRVAETLDAGNTASYTESLVCEANGNPVAVNPDGEFTMPGAPVECRFTNVRAAGTVTLQKQWVDSVTGDTARLEIIGGSPSSAGATSRAPAPPSDVNRAVATVNSGDVVTVREVLPGANGTRYDPSISCTGGVTPAPDATNPYQWTFQMGANPVVCTIENRARTHTVTLQKAWVGALAGDTADLAIVGGTPDPARVTSTAPTSANTSASFRVGDRVSVAEGVGGRGAYTSTLRCVDGQGGVVAEADGRTDEFDMPDTSVTCTFTNTRTQHRVTLQKRWVDAVDGDGAVLTVSHRPDDETAVSTAPDVPSSQNSASLVVRSGETVAVTEELRRAGNTANVGGYSTQLSCSAGVTTTPVQGNPLSETFTMPDREVTCTFTNTRTEHTLTLRKEWVDAAVGDVANLRINGGVTDPAEAVSTAPGGVSDPRASTLVRSGDDVRVVEGLPSTNTGRYDRKLQCTGGASPDDSGRFAMPDGDVECVFTNSRIANPVTLQKVWVDGVQGHTADLSITAGSATPVTVQSVSNGDRGDWTDPNSASAGVVGGTQVTLAETLGNPADYTGRLTCEGATPNAQGVFTMPEGPVTCVYTNTRKRFDVTLRKQWVDAATDDAARMRVTGGANGPAGSTSVAPEAPGRNPTVTEVLVGDRVTVSEELAAGNRGTYEAVLDCPGVAPVNGAFDMPGNDVTCTFTNTRKQFRVTLEKAWVDSVPGDVANLEITGGLTDPATGRSTAPGVQGDTSATTRAYSGDTVLLDEALPTGNAGRYDQELKCSAGAQLKGKALTVPGDRDVVCTWTNTLERGRLVVTKVFDAKNSGFTGTFEITYDCVGSADGSVRLAGSPQGEASAAIDVPAGVCTVDEPNLPTPPTDWQFGRPTFDPSDQRVVVTKGQTAQAVVQNTITRDTGELLLVKKVDGGTRDAADWTLTAVSGVTPEKNYSEPGDNTAFREVWADVPYALAESPAPGQLDYTAGEWSCDAGTQQGASIIVPKGTKVTCTVINSRDVALLRLVKKVEGKADPDRWELAAQPAERAAPSVRNAGATGVFEEVWTSVEYTLSESGPADYTSGGWTCQDDGGGPALNTGDRITLTKGMKVTCTVLNVRDTAELKLVKQVTGKGNPDDWTLEAQARAPEDDKDVSTPGASGTFQSVYSGIPYTLSESGPDGYSPSDWTCTDEASPGAAVNSGDKLTLAKGQKVVCTIVNSRDLGSLTITKEFDAKKSGYTGSFDITYDCVDGSDPVKSGTVSLAAGESSTVGGLPTGTRCTVAEPTLPGPPVGWRFEKAVLAPDGGTVTVASIGEDVRVTVTNAITSVTAPKTPREVCPIKVTLTKPVPKKAGNQLLVKRIKTSKACKVPKPVVICRPLSSTAAGEKTFCTTKVTKRGRIRVRVGGYDRVRVTVIVRAKPEKGQRDDWRANTWRRSWILR
jgi:hypothetical protein